MGPQAPQIELPRRPSNVLTSLSDANGMVINMLRLSYPVTLIHEALDCPRSSDYYQARQLGQTQLAAAIRTVLAEWLPIVLGA